MINIKTPDEIRKMKESGRLAASCMEEIIANIRPGVTTRQLDIVAEEYITSRGAWPSFKDYRGFPASICASVNDEVVHGIPDGRLLRDGDIIGIDFGAVLDGYHSDMARTVAVGDVPEEAQKLIEATKECFYAGFEQALDGNRVGDISRAVEARALAGGYTVVRELVGHGIGKNLHEQPDVPNFAFRGPNPRLRAGMVICIEPLVNMGGEEVYWGNDGWVVKTKDKSLSAHYENTVAVTDNGPEILTKV
jgi:methionyl aminopeptidase